MTGSAEMVAAATAGFGCDAVGAAEIDEEDVGAAEIDVWPVNVGGRGGRPLVPPLASGPGAGGLAGKTPGGGLKGCEGGPDGGGR